jgi:NDP-sugar pyrophosphorylase family protein
LIGLILAGGFATRLRPLSCSKPKLLFPVVGVPLINSMAHWLSSGGVDKIILAVNHLSDKLKVEIGDRIGDVGVTFSVEEVPLGTAGPIRLAETLLGRDEPFFVINGDIVSDIDIKAMLAFHREKRADATIALVSVPDPAPYGSVSTDSRGTVRSFEEKSGRPPSASSVNAGVYVLDPGVIEFIPAGKSVSLERSIFPSLAEKGGMQGWRHDGFWYDIGRVSEYVRANKELLERREPNPHERKEQDSNGTHVIRPAHIGARSRLGVGAQVGPLSILSDSVSIGDAAIVRNSIVFEETTIGDKSVVEDAVVGERVVIGRDSRIGSGSIIAGQVSLPAGSLVLPGSVILS